MKTDVIIIGAGPTGLMAANQLSRFGIDYIIIDSKDGPTHESRAIAVSARSLEIYQQLGVIDEVVNNGKKIESFNVFSEGKPQVSVNFNNIGKGLSDFYYLLAYEQSKNETLLYNHIQTSGHDVLWNTSFTKYNEYEDRVIVEAQQDENILTIEGKYLIACDGARSPVRHQLGFNFSGGTYENKFIVADTTLDWDQEYNKLILCPGRKNFVAFLPLYGDKNYRIIGTLPKACHDKDDISFQDIEKTIKETATFDVSFEKVNWFSVYKLHHRCVDRFNTKRVYLAGDAAHIHSPAGGQGMNTGLQDAYNLCWKLAMVLKGSANEKLLETYNEERLPFAQWLVHSTDRMFGVMTSDNLFLHWLRKYGLFQMMKLIIMFTYTRKKMFNTVSQLWYSYKGKSLSANASKQKLAFDCGDRLPYLDYSKQGKSFYDLFNDPGWHLLHIGDSALTGEQEHQLSELFPFPVNLVENSINEEWKKYGVLSELFLLIRPDNYIALISDTMNQDAISAYRQVLKNYFVSNDKPSTFASNNIRAA